MGTFSPAEDSGGLDDFFCFSLPAPWRRASYRCFGLAVLVSRDYELFNRRVFVNLAISLCLFALTIVVIPVVRRVLHVNIPIADQTLFVVLCLLCRVCNPWIYEAGLQ